MVFGVRKTVAERSDNPRAIFEAPSNNFFKLLTKFVQDIIIVKNFTLKIKLKIISKHQIYANDNYLLQLFRTIFIMHL